jgi:hypothetical protein
MAKDATKGKVVVWRSEPVAKNLLNHFVLDTSGNAGRVLAMKGKEHFVIALDGLETLRYLRVDELVGWRVFDSKEARNRAQAKMITAENLRRCPAELVGVAA